ncbi:hypothetical protein EDB19DRAFT_96348 [Suillus lakei]|nr:hypothetical protein EDB19DRAFT_96348 [Suillus lakei]
MCHHTVLSVLLLGNFCVFLRHANLSFSYKDLFQKIHSDTSAIRRITCEHEQHYGSCSHCAVQGRLEGRLLEFDNLNHQLHPRRAQTSWKQLALQSAQEYHLQEGREGLQRSGTQRSLRPLEDCGSRNGYIIL